MARRGNARVRIVYNHLPEIARRIPGAANEIIADTLAEIDTAVKTGMGGAHSGRIYGGHQASAPGEMPAVDTDQLRGSLKVEQDKAKTTGYYYTETETAPHLEFGTVDMAARPFMTPAAEDARPGFEDAFRDLEEKLR